MQQNVVGDPVELTDGDRGRSGVEGDPGQAAGLADRPQSAVRVRVGLDVNRDAVGAGVGELGYLLGRALDHQVDVEHSAGVVDLIRDRGGDERADRYRGHETAVHDVDVDHPRAGLHHLGHRGAEASEVGGEDRRRHAAPRERPVVGSGVHTGFSIECPHCWQVRSSSLVIRTIVWCSPQSGQAETSS